MAMILDGPDGPVSRYLNGSRDDMFLHDLVIADQDLGVLQHDSASNARTFFGQWPSLDDSPMVNQCPGLEQDQMHVDDIPPSQAIPELQQNNSDPRHDLRGPTSADWIKVLRMIVVNIFETPSDDRKSLKLEDLAKEAGLSPFHFQRVFKTTTQMTPGDFTNACQTLALQDGLAR